MNTYSFEHLKASYADLGVGENDVVYVMSDISMVANFEQRGGAAVLNAHYRALVDLLGDHGTLVVPTGCLNLINSKEVFNVQTTPSRRFGALSEFVRRRDGALRSYHPFISYTALGPKASDIVSDVSRHAYGMETPESRMIESNALVVIVGVPPERSMSTVHHVEQVMSVPYRRVREIIHPVVRGESIKREPFYYHDLYPDIQVVKDGNRNLFKRLRGKLEIRKVKLGAASLHAFLIADFYRHAVQVFADDPYIWCAEPPKIRPYVN
jgi:aminoglycoside 3-N-acetyltransferase